MTVNIFTGTIYVDNFESDLWVCYGKVVTMVAVYFLPFYSSFSRKRVSFICKILSFIDETVVRIVRKDGEPETR
jgi:hypothetical protein